MWAVATTDTFDAWFAELGEEAQAETIAKVDLLKLLGPQLGRPHADTLKGSKHANMKELRRIQKMKCCGSPLHSTRSDRRYCW